MSENRLDALLRNRVKPSRLPGLESRIINAAAAISIRRDWRKEFAALFVLPYPAAILPLIMLAGLFLGLGMPQESNMSSPDLSNLLYLEEVWL